MRMYNIYSYQYVTGSVTYNMVCTVANQYPDHTYLAQDGKVTNQEQQAWMVQQSPQVQQEMMSAVDSNQDGTVTVAEQQVSVSLPLSPSLPLSNLLVYIMDRCIYAFKQHHTLSQTYTVQAWLARQAYNQSQKSPVILH